MTHRTRNGHERIRQIHVGAAVMLRPTPAGPELLLAQRPPGEALAGFWEFPGGKLEAGETALHAVVREVREELGVDVQAIELMAQVAAEMAKDPTVHKQMSNFGSVAVDNTPAEFVKFLRDETALWGNLVKQSGAGT